MFRLVYSAVAHPVNNEEQSFPMFSGFSIESPGFGGAFFPWRQNIDIKEESGFLDPFQISYKNWLCVSSSI